jgi:hypothetical protein
MIPCVRRKEGFTMILYARSTSRSLTVALMSLALTVPALTSFAGDAFAEDAPVAPVAVAETQVAPGHAHAGAAANVSGEVTRYVVGPLGHVRGFILKDGTVVMVPRESGDVMAKAVPVGQTVRVEGWSPTASGGKEVMRAAVYGQHGQIIAAPAPGEWKRDREARKTERATERAEIKKLPAASANGTVETVVLGRGGRPEALVLNDGTSVFLRHSLAKAVMSRGIRVGDRIQSEGKGATYAAGSSVVITSITFADGTRFEAKTGPRGERT